MRNWLIRNRCRHLDESKVRRTKEIEFWIQFWNRLFVWPGLVKLALKQQKSKDVRVLVHEVSVSNFLCNAETENQQAYSVCSSHVDFAISCTRFILRKIVTLPCVQILRQVASTWNLKFFLLHEKNVAVLQVVYYRLQTCYRVWLIFVKIPRRRSSCVKPQIRSLMVSKYI